MESVNKSRYIFLATLVLSVLLQHNLQAATDTEAYGFCVLGKAGADEEFDEDDFHDVDEDEEDNIFLPYVAVAAPAPAAVASTVAVPLLRRQESDGDVPLERSSTIMAVQMVPFAEGKPQITLYTGAEAETFVASATVPVDRVAAVGPVYTEAELGNLVDFAHTFFKDTAEAVFALEHGQNEASYMAAYLALNSSSEGRPYNPRTISPEDLRIQFDRYLAQAHEQYRNGDAWLDKIRTGFFSGRNHDFYKRQATFVEKKIIRASGQPPQTLLFMGDLHGSMHALLRNLLIMKQLGYLQDDFSLANNVHLVFLGDLTDRGLQGIESVYTVLRLKNKNWNQVHIARGNHENGDMVGRFGFFQEIASKYNDFGAGVVDEIKESYAQFCSSLPSALFLGVHDDTKGVMRFMQACHGGIAPHHDPRNLLAADRLVCFESVSYGAPQHGMQYEWNDVCCVKTDERLNTSSSASNLAAIPWSVNRNRGPGVTDIYVLHRDDITQLLARNGLFMLMRGHQDQGAPCKVLQEGEEDPISWRVHKEFLKASIKPTSFLHRGIKILDAPNCFTMTNATEARGLFSEGFLGLTINPDFEKSRVWVCEVDLMKQPLMNEWHQKASAMYESSSAMRRGLENDFAFWALLRATESRHGKYMQHEGLPMSVLLPSSVKASSGEAAASPEPGSFDGEIATPTDWVEMNIAAGIDTEINSAFPSGQYHRPSGEACKLIFGKGTVRDVFDCSKPSVAAFSIAAGYHED